MHPIRWVSCDSSQIADVENVRYECVSPPLPNPIAFNATPYEVSNAEYEYYESRNYDCAHGTLDKTKV